MTPLSRVPSRTKTGDVHVVIEAPRGAQVKLKYEPELGVMTVSRPLPIGLSYPYDWGFVPSTRAEDGDPLDALVLADVGTWPGVVVPCRPLGVIRLDQKPSKAARKRQRNDRVIFVPALAPRLESLEKPTDLPRRTREEIERFFLDTTFFTIKEARVLGWGGPAEAWRAIERAERAGADDH